MDYFCYISRSKVDQLFRSLDQAEADEWTEQRISAHDFNANIEGDLTVAKILSLFKGGVTYGRRGVLQREQKVKLHYVEKLRRVLLELSTQRPIPRLGKSLTLGELTSLYYHHAGSFVVDPPVQDPGPDKIVTLMTEVAQHRLSLDCSLRFFSEGSEGDGRFVLHSGNARFFAAKLPLRLETVFVLLGREGIDLIGTPIFLKFSPQDTHEFVAL